MQRAVARIVESEISDPRLQLVTITGAEVSPDVSYATIYYTPVDPGVVSGSSQEAGGDRVPDPDEVAEGFVSAASRIRALLGERLQARRTPELRFERDPVVEQAGRVEALLRDLRADDEL